jgi:hypothetical protein
MVTGYGIGAVILSLLGGLLPSSVKGQPACSMKNGIELILSLEIVMGKSDHITQQ